MAKKQDTYNCTECGWTSVRWVGRCGECQAWGTVVERGAPKLRAVATSVPTQQAVPISQVPTDTAQRKLTTIAELDRVLGDGLVPGAVILLAGEPGVGKSTLLLDVAAKWARSGEKTLYISGEESASQVRLRAERTGAVDDELYLASETDLGTVLGHMEQVRPSLLVLDSVQTISTAEADGAPGGPSQVREITAAIARVAKRENMAAIIVGHVTKDGAIAGPRILEHMVDTVLYFEGEASHSFRVLRSHKNRFGSTNEIGVFEMRGSGLEEVEDPSALFLAERPQGQPGSVVTAAVSGTRPLLVEVQALVAPTQYGTGQRKSIGVDANRVALLAAVLERKLGLSFGPCDVFVNVAGGVQLTEPAADLAVCAALVSSRLEQPVPSSALFFGEVGLAGEVRGVTSPEARIAEGAKMGFDLAYLPSTNLRRLEASGIPAVGVAELRELLTSLFPDLDLDGLRGSSPGGGSSHW